MNRSSDILSDESMGHEPFPLLPLELREKVIKSLVQSNNPYAYGFADDVRNALLNLCRSSRHLNAVATSLLYSSIIVYNKKHLIKIMALKKFLRHIRDLSVRPALTSCFAEQMLSLLKGPENQLKRFSVVLESAFDRFSTYSKTAILSTLSMTELFMTVEDFSGVYFPPKFLPISTIRRLFLRGIRVSMEWVDIINSMPFLEVLVLYKPFNLEGQIATSLFTGYRGEALRRRVKFMLFGHVDEILMRDGEGFREVVRLPGFDQPSLIWLHQHVEAGTLWDLTGEQLKLWRFLPGPDRMYAI